jgi:hypothetical protein
MNHNFNYSIPFLSKIRSYCIKMNKHDYLIPPPARTDFYYTITLDNFELFHLFPEDICQLLFKNYIQFPSIKDSIYSTLITAILENKIISHDIFHQCLRCNSYLKYPCSQTSTHCCYSYRLTNKTKLVAWTEHYMLSFIPFKNFNVHDLMNLFVKEKI